MRTSFLGELRLKYALIFALTALVLFFGRWRVEDKEVLTENQRFRGFNRADSQFEDDDYSDFPKWPAGKPRRPNVNPLDSDVGAKGSEDDVLVQMAKRNVNDGLIIMVYASYSYREPLFNWLIGLQKSRGSATKGVMLVCLDDALADAIRLAGWDCSVEPIVKKASMITASTSEAVTSEDASALDKNTVKSLWVARVDHLLRILRAGVNVVLSDTDAIWLKDATQFLGDNELGDIISSKANFPYDSPWGATLCMGFIFFRSNPQVIRLAQAALVQTVTAQDDQIGFNRALFDLPFEDPTGKKMAFGRRLTPSGNTVAKADFVFDENKSERSNSIRVTLLPHSWVSRYCALVPEEDWSKVYVAHCHVNEGKPAPTNKHKGNQATHTAILEKYHVYYLNTDWETIFLQQLTERKSQTGSINGRESFEALIRALTST